MAKQTPLEFARELVEKHHDVYQLESLAVEHALLTVDEKFKSIKDSFGGNTKTSIKLMKLSKAYKELLEVKQILHNPLTEYDI